MKMVWSACPTRRWKDCLMLLKKFVHARRRSSILYGDQILASTVWNTESWSNTMSISINLWQVMSAALSDMPQPAALIDSGTMMLNFGSSFPPFTNMRFPRPRSTPLRSSLLSHACWFRSANQRNKRLTFTLWRATSRECSRRGLLRQGKSHVDATRLRSRIAVTSGRDDYKLPSVHFIGSGCRIRWERKICLPQ